MGGRVRRIAAHRVICPDGSVMRQAVVTLENGLVVGVVALLGEEERTEWLGGTIALRTDACGHVRAWHEEHLLE